ncbi:MAG: succinate dehydrogenase cytochrome b subunit [Flavobacteriia bacterium]|jgi:succinate dehydrogenase / fumarate reductase cytochrome b subunit
MSKSAILSSSIAKKYWMALTGLFLCLFLVGHLLGNLQLILKTGEEGRRAFNEYAYFMTHNPLIKVMSYLTYLSILFHAIDGILLAIQNKKARPVSYAYNNPGANSSTFARQMAVLGSAILIFIVIHMSNFWWKMKYSSDPMPLHKVMVKDPQSGQEQGLYVTQTDNFLPTSAFENTPMGEAQMEIKNGTEFHNKQVKVKMGEGYKDLHSLTVAFFGQDKSEYSPIFKANDKALFAVILYVLAMAVLSFHLMHGFSSAFQSLGLNHKRYMPGITLFGKLFAVLVPLAFALIPIIIFLNK